MQEIKNQRIKFVGMDRSEFFPSLRKKVDQYFDQRGITRFGNSRVVFKICFMFLLYLGCYVLILSNLFPLPVLLLLVFLMALGKAGVGLAVMHDANHGSLFSKPWLNKIFGSSIILLGGSKKNWEIQHNLLHHNYTNIHEEDEDIKTKFILRLSFYARLRSYHKYQHLYAFLLYCLMTLSFLYKDFIKVKQYYRQGLLRGGKKVYRKQFLNMVAAKLIYFVFILLVPFFILNLLWWQIMLGFLLMHATVGIILSVIFQLAHIVKETEQTATGADHTISNDWAVHQVNTTANFANANKVLTWYSGGLNYQIEHHLFPNICHVHYPDIAKIVRKTTQQFRLPYHCNETLLEALKSHVKMLKCLGRVTYAQAGS